MEKFLEKCPQKRGSDGKIYDLEEVDGVFVKDSDQQNILCKRKRYEVPFRQEWKSRFVWLQQENSPQGKRCSVCNVSIAGGLAHLARHESRESHKRGIKIMKSVPKMQEFIENRKANNFSAGGAQKLEVILSLFVAEHNLSFSTLDHLNLVLKQNISDSQIIKHMNINRKKGQKIIKRVTAPQNVKEITKFCKTHYYSLIVDESTDLTTSKNLAIIIRIYDEKCMDRFLDLVPITDCTSSGIFETIKTVLNQNFIPMQNMVAFTADNCSVMMGTLSGVQARLKNVIPNLFVNGCICHNLNLISASASQAMPKEIDKFLKAVNYHFCNSSNRKADFKKFQEYFGAELHAILRYSTTRWLSREAVIARILEQWNALRYYFTLHDFEKGEADENIKLITNILSNPVFKMYFMFLAYILKITNSVNIEMQSEDARIHVFLPRLKLLFFQVARHFMDKDYLDKNAISEINFHINNIDVKDIYCGAEVDLFICNNKVEEFEILKFKENVKNYCFIFCNTMRKKIKFDDQVLYWASNFSPANVLSGKVTSIVPLINLLFPQCEIDKIENINAEYRALADCHELKDSKNLSICEFWKNVKNLKNAFNEPLFSNIYNIAQGILSISHSSANVERIFSVQNLIKTKCRNRLQVETVSSLIKTRDFIKHNQECCYNTKISEEMLLKMSNASMESKEDDSLID